MSYVAIDPGIDTGWAVFHSATELVCCGVGDPRVPCKSAKTVILERPVIYTARMSKGDPNNIVTLAIGLGRYIEYFETLGARVAMVTPSTWKGSIPKEIHHARVQAALSPQNKGVLDACLQYTTPSERHNVLDAVALGFAAFQKKMWLQ